MNQADREALLVVALLLAGFGLALYGFVSLFGWPFASLVWGLLLIAIAAQLL